MMDALAREGFLCSSVSLDVYYYFFFCLAVLFWCLLFLRLVFGGLIKFTVIKKGKKSFSLGESPRLL